MSAIHELLEMSDTAERQQLENAARLTDDDRAAIRAYCEACIGRDTMSAEAKSESKTLKVQTADARQRLEQWMRANQLSCAVMPRALLRENEATLSAAGLPAQPPYVRIKRNNCDRTITPEVVDAAFREVSREAIMELESASGEDAMCEAVIGAVRRAVRSFKEQCTLSESMERGKKFSDAPELPIELAREAFRLHASFSQAKAAAGRCKASLAPRIDSIKQQQPIVEGVLDKLCVTSQQVEVSGAPYRLVKRSSTSKPRLSLNILSEVIRDVIRAEASALSGGGTKSDACRVWEASRDTFLRATLMRIAARPAARSSKVILQRVRVGAAGEQDDEEEEEEEEDS